MRNIVLLCLDSVRKDVYEEEMERTKELVDESLDQCRAASSWSVPSHASFLTGQLPHEHGVHSHAIDFGSLSRGEVLTTRTPFERTVSVSANQFTSTEFGFDRWFDECRTVGSTSFYPDGLDVRTTEGVLGHFTESLRHENTLKSVANGAVNAAVRLSDSLPVRTPVDDGVSATQRLVKRSVRESPEPYFIFVNLMQAHQPHRLIRWYDDRTGVPKQWSSGELDLMYLNERGPEAIEEHGDYVENFRRLYRLAVDYLDRCVSELIRDVRRLSDGEVTFVVTADHGENLGYASDDHLFGHTASLSESLLHVPFDVVNPPDCVEMDADRLFSQRHLRDVVEALAREVPVTRSDERYVPAELVGALQDTDEYWDRAIRCVYDPANQTKVVWDSLGNAYRAELDDSGHSDRGERHRIETVPEWATDQFDVEISAYKSRASGDGESETNDLEEGTRERLEELGYL